MTELTAPKSPLTANEFADEIRQALKYTQGVTPEQAKTADVYVATLLQDHLRKSLSDQHPDCQKTPAYPVLPPGSHL